MTRQRKRARALAVFCVAAFLGFAQSGPVERALAVITPTEFIAHVRFLASDALRGRAPGTPGGRVAAEYIASEMLRAGLRPAGESWFQRVPLLGVTPDTSRVRLGFTRGDGAVGAVYGDDAVVWTPFDTAAAVDAELVFAGYGIRSSSEGWDDFKGADVRGKVLLVLVNEPPAPPDDPDRFDGTALTYYGRWTYKLEEAERLGAAGVLIVHSPDAAGYAWSVVRSSWSGERLFLRGDGATPRNAPLRGWVQWSFARGVLALADLDLDELYVQAARPDFHPVRTGITVHCRIPVRARRLESANVVGVLNGRSPSLASQVVTYTAHYDHLGVGTPVDGDSIYNGAYDNASGVALLLEVARAFGTLDPAPRRSILFIATTAEEAGTLGAEYYVRHPVVPLDRTVAELNVDGANPWGRTDDVDAIGMERSSLGPVVARRARQLGMKAGSDRAPERGLFFRLDQFPFAREGVPAMSIAHGLDFRDRPLGWGRQLLQEYDARHYHQPSDELRPDMTFEGAVQQARLAFLVGLDVADSAKAPEWYPGARPDTAASPHAGR